MEKASGWTPPSPHQIGKRWFSKFAKESREGVPQFNFFMISWTYSDLTAQLSVTHGLLEGAGTTCFGTRCSADAGKFAGDLVETAGGLLFELVESSLLSGLDSKPERVITHIF